MPADCFQEILAHLHLLAVLPALEELARLSPEAGAIAKGWRFPLRLRLRGGPQATLLPKDGSLGVSSAVAVPGSLTLNFLSAPQLNKTFRSQPALPPVPSGALWHLVHIKRFTQLTQLLDAALQPTASALEDPKFLDLHLRLLFKVLFGALPVLASRDEASRHALATTPRGLVELRMDALGLLGWANWNGAALTTGHGQPPSAPDVQIIFRDGQAAAAALRSQLDATAAVGRGQIEIRGLVPLADGINVAIDRVESYLKPAA